MLEVRIHHKDTKTLRRKKQRTESQRTWCLGGKKIGNCKQEVGWFEK
jgi:hypothetical protein